MNGLRLGSHEFHDEVLGAPTPSLQVCSYIALAFKKADLENQRSIAAAFPLLAMDCFCWINYNHSAGADLLHALKAWTELRMSGAAHKATVFTALGFDPETVSQASREREADGN